MQQTAIQISTENTAETRAEEKKWWALFFKPGIGESSPKNLELIYFRLFSIIEEYQLFIILGVSCGLPFTCISISALLENPIDTQDAIPAVIGSILGIIMLINGIILHRDKKKKEERIGNIVTLFDEVLIFSIIHLICLCEEYENESSVITIYRYEGILFTRIGTSGEKREVPDEQVVFYGKIDSSKIEVGMFTKEEVLSNIKENFDFSNEPLKDEVHDKWLEEIY